MLSSVRPGPVSARFFSASSLSASKTVFVGNWPFNGTPADLKRLFEEHGTVERAKVPTDRGGKSRGYGFVTFTHEADVDNAIKTMNGKHLLARKLCVYASESGAHRSTNERQMNSWERHEYDGGQCESAMNIDGTTTAVYDENSRAE